MATITAKLLAARSDKKDTLPAAADPKRDRVSSPRGPPRSLTSRANHAQIGRISRNPRKPMRGLWQRCVKDKAVAVTADYLGRRDCEAALHSSKVRTANRPFALYNTWISSPQSSTSARRGR